MLASTASVRHVYCLFGNSRSSGLQTSDNGNELGPDESNVGYVCSTLSVLYGDSQRACRRINRCLYMSTERLRQRGDAKIPGRPRTGGGSEHIGTHSNHRDRLLERVSKPGFGIRGRTQRLPRSLRSLAMTEYGKVLASRALRAESLNLVIARSAATKHSRFGCIEGFETGSRWISVKARKR